MSNSRHIIHRQLFELTACTGQPAWEWDRTSADFYRDQLLPALEACFNEADRSGEHLVIDRIEVDLGVFGGKDAFVHEAGERLRERLVLGIRQQRQEAAANGHQPSAARSYLITTESAEQPSGNHPSESENGADGRKKRSEISPALLGEKEAPVTAFLHFLVTGRLPWWYEHMGKECFGMAFQEALTETDIRNIMDVLRGSRRAAATDLIDVEGVTAAVIRCIQALDDKVLLVLAGSKGWDEQVLRNEWELLRTATKQFANYYPAFRQRYWSGVLAAAARENPAPWSAILPAKETPAQLVVILLSEVRQSGQAALQSLTAFLESRVGASGTNDAGAASGNKEKKLLSEDAAFNTPIVQPKKDTKVTNINTDITEEEGLYVEAAGLVLLHPFLTELFTATGCRVGKEWTAAGQQTAVRLLGYLSDGDENLPEYRLVFQKVLAGMAPEAPLEAIAPVSEEKLSACDELLEAVLHHWAALRNTGADGLREGFLQRPGILRANGNGIQLEMEKRAQDVLITRLPWSCSLVRLSWMEQLIAVNWI